MAQQELVAFGLAVRQQRGRLALSQEELAERSNLHRTYISGVERGQRNIGLLNVHKVAAALGVSASDLLASAEVFRRKGRR